MVSNEFEKRFPEGKILDLSRVSGSILDPLRIFSGGSSTDEDQAANCGCSCHAVPGVHHIIACCGGSVAKEEIND